jgi:hypothetical protein
MMVLLDSRPIIDRVWRAGPLRAEVRRLAHRKGEELSVMFQARLMIPWSLLIVACALAGIVKLPVAAQVPKQPADVTPDAVVNAKDEGMDPVFKKLVEIVSKKPVVMVPVDDELQSLLLARRDAAMRRAKALRSWFADGGISIDKYFDGISLVLDAQHELTDNPADHVPILDVRLVMAKAIESKRKADQDTGRSTLADVEEARYRRLSVEIDLLRTKKKLPKK